MKARNQRLSFSNQKDLFRMKEELEWIGRYVVSYDLEKLELVVSPYPKTYKKKTEAERKLREKREARSYDDYEDYAAKYNS